MRNEMKIVVLDDSKTVLLTIHALLEELGVPDESISLFSDGYKALEYIEQHGADIIFSDINMPGMDGFEFVGRLLELSQRFVSTLFIVSADERCEDITHMKNIGAKRFLRKPINAKHFNHFVSQEIAKATNRNTLSSVLLEEETTEDVAVTFGTIDHEELAHKIGIKVKHIPLLVESFLNEAKELSEKLHTLRGTKKYAEIEQCAHSLKGSSGNMQFMELYEMARAMEHASQYHNEVFDYEGCCTLIGEEIVSLSKRLVQ